MKKIILIILLSAFGTIALCQDITIKSGSEVTLLLSKRPDQKYSFTVLSNKPMNKSIGLENNLLKDKVDTNQVKIVFGKGKSDGKTQTYMIIKTGLTEILKYTAKIRYADSNKFQLTDVNPVIGNVKSTEWWQNDITEINLSDFSKGSF